MFHEYVSDRTQVIIINGVPRGTVYGPLLFKIYINNIITTTQTFNIIFYADDTILYEHGSSPTQAMSTLTIHVIIHIIILLYAFLPLTHNGTETEVGLSYKYLGVWFGDCFFYQNTACLPEPQIKKQTNKGVDLDCWERKKILNVINFQTGINVTCWTGVTTFQHPDPESQRIHWIVKTTSSTKAAVWSHDCSDQ